MSEIEFLRDDSLDNMISDIVDIFNNVEGVELVRLSGMTKRANRISGKHDIPKEAIDSIIQKLKSAGIVQYKHVVHCPHCGEQSYIIKCSDDFLQKPKMCDSCSTFFSPVANLIT